MSVMVSLFICMFLCLMKDVRWCWKSCLVVMC